MQSQAEGMLNVKRGGKKKISKDDHRTNLNEVENSMEVDDVVGNKIEQNMDVDTGICTLDKGTITSGEQLEQNDALDTSNMIVADNDEVTDNISDTITQTLGCIEGPINIQLAADFEDLPRDSLCDISMNTLSDVDMVSGVGDENTAVTGSKTPQNDSQTVTNDANVNNGITKRKRGRPKLTKSAVEEETRNNEELLKLLQENGESLLSKEAKEVFRDLLKRKKKIYCPREGCGKKFTYFTGFEYHVVRCGRPDAQPELICEECGKLYRSAAGLTYHKRTAHDKIKEKKEIVDLEVGTSKSKYILRQRAETEGKNYAEDCDGNGSDASFDGTERPSVALRGIGWKKHAEKLDDESGDEAEETKTELTNMTEISEAFRDKRMLKCPKNCGRSFRSAAGTYQHAKACKGRERYRCKLCGKILTSRSGIRMHIIILHRRKEHNSEDDEESEFSESEERTVPMKRKYFGKKFDFKMSTITWYKEFLSETSFTCWRPSLKYWISLSPSEAESYLPVRKISPVFRIEAVKGNRSTPERSKEYQLPLFSSTPVNSAANLLNITFNVGGSVWAMDWVPVPVDKEDSDQYIAIGCHSDPDKTHLLSERYKEKGVLQFWRVPKLQNETIPTEQAEFSFGLVYDYGPLWDIRWCPSRAWDESFPAGELRRLGLLALACADGKVRIFSVLFPDSLKEKDNTNSEKSPEISLYRAVPHLVLTPGSLCRKYQDECGPAWQLSWQPINGHKKIIASYADGTVAVYDLETKSPILKSTTEDGLTEHLFPISHFQAHNSVIRSLAWCPSDPNYIATGGYDKIIKIWDLRHTSQPVLCFSKAVSYHLTWPIHLGVLLYNTDSANRVKGTRCLDYYASSRSEKCTGHISFSYVSQNSAAWDNDYSNWTNVVAAVDAAGAISINHLTPALAQKNRKNVKVPLFRALFEPITEHQEQSIPEEDFPNETEGKKEYPFKIVFKDIHPSVVKSGEKYPLFNDEAFVMPSQPTHTALHKVRWNPNFSSFYWLATGGQFGLVRLCYIN